jgi:uncharacterized protein involved in type VI secretion and phage assembly
MSDPNLILSAPSIKHSGAPLSDVEMATLAEVVVDLDATRPGLFVLRFLLTAAPGTETDPGFNVGDEVEVGESSTSTTLIKGEVTSVEAEFGNAGQRLTVRGHDKSHRLHRARKYRTFLQQKDSDIASTLAGEASIGASTDATSVVHKFIAQVNQTDWEFLKWRAEENAYALFFADGQLNFQKQVTGGSSPVKSFSVTDDLHAFRPRISAPPVSTVTTRAWDESQKQKLEGSGSVSSSDAASLTDTPSSLGGQFGSNTHLSTIRSAEAAGDVSDLATALAGRFADSFVEAEAVTAYGDPNLTPGQLIEVKDAGSTFNGKYRITSARHIFNAHQRYVTSMRCSGTQDKSLLALTNGNGGGPATRMPRIQGLVPAIVTNLNDPDKRYRVKVKFPWLDDQVESDWMRVVHFGAGPKHGAIFLPEVNDEVIVGFEQGDFRRGYVLGGVYNGKDSPDTDLGTVVDNGVVKARGFSSNLNHRLIFDDDSSGKSGIHLLSGDKNFEIYIDQKNTKITIDSKNGKVEIHGAQDVSIKSDQNIAIEATQKLSLKGTGGVEINSPQDVTLSGLNAKISANAKASVTGNAGLDLTTTAIAQIQGSLVKIN